MREQIACHCWEYYIIIERKKWYPQIEAKTYSQQCNRIWILTLARQECLILEVNQHIMTNLEYHLWDYILSWTQMLFECFVLEYSLPCRQSEFLRVWFCLPFEIKMNIMSNHVYKKQNCLSFSQEKILRNYWSRRWSGQRSLYFCIL